MLLTNQHRIGPTTIVVGGGIEENKYIRMQRTYQTRKRKILEDKKRDQYCLKVDAIAMKPSWKSLRYSTINNLFSTNVTKPKIH